MDIFSAIFCTLYLLSKLIQSLLNNKKELSAFVHGTKQLGDENICGLLHFKTSEESTLLCATINENTMLFEGIPRCKSVLRAQMENQRVHPKLSKTQYPSVPNPSNNLTPSIILGTPI